VLTKLDLMDAGTNALDILTGRTYPLKLGFIGVVNRSQQDINAGLPMEEALRKEEEFFRNHPAYRNLAHRCGTKYLAKSLNHVSIFGGYLVLSTDFSAGSHEPHSRQIARHEG
jgi:dynamin 1-like protein